MEQWTIQFELLSETIFGSGESVPGVVDLEVTYDDYGLPYFKGKTLKGKLREEAENIKDKLSEINPTLKLESYVTSLFGQEGNDGLNGLKLSNCTFAPSVLQGVQYGIETGMFTKDEVIQSLTTIRSFTSIDESGTAKEGSLRKIRMINKNNIFISHLTVDRELMDIEKELLAASVSSLRHIGTMESRGKGEVRANLLFDGQDVTKKYLDLFLERVNKK